ncbi:MAG: peptidylprolyl isomerase [Aquificae bacterium]|nr:peptidylprolyl isomerase [Aquificota bacterium]
MVRIITFLLVFLFSLSYSQDRDVELYDRIVMVVNGQPVLQSELELAMEWFGIKDRKEAAQRLIDQILVSQAAEKLGIRVSPQEVEEAILRIARANRLDSVEEFKKKLEEKNLSYTEFKDLVERELLIQRYIQVHLRRTLFGGIKEGKQLKLRKVRIIFLSAKNDNFSQKYTYLRQNLKPENFGEMAKKYSDDPITAEKEGLLGEVKKGDLIKKLDDAIWSRKVGEIFEVPVENGVYFVYVESEEEKMVNQQPTGEEIKEKLKQEYELQLKKLRQQATIEYIDKSLQPEGES